MARNKFKRVAISDERSRKSTLKKRSQSLFKKVSELSTLCDVDAVAVVRDPKDDEKIVWPSREAVEDRLGRFSSLSDMEKSKKMTTHKSFVVESMRNEEEKYKRLANKNDEREMTYLMKDYLNGSARTQDLDVKQIGGLITFLSNVENSLQTRKQELQNSEQPQHQELRQSPADLASHSNHYCISFRPQQQQKQQELPLIGSSAGASHSHYYPQRQQEQLHHQSNTTTSYLDNTHQNPETMAAALSCEHCFTEMMFHNRNIMDLHWQHHPGVGFPQSTDALAGGSNMGLNNQTAGVENVAGNYAFPTSRNENTNTFNGAKNN